MAHRASRHKHTTNCPGESSPNPRHERAAIPHCMPPLCLPSPPAYTSSRLLGGSKGQKKTQKKHVWFFPRCFQNLGTCMPAHTLMNNQLVCVHMWVHAHIPTGQEDGLMCPSSLPESWSQEDARTLPGELVRGHQCRESDKHHGKVLTWASRVITGLGCAACGKRGENTRERWEKCNLLPRHQATPAGKLAPLCRPHST